jgi:hypothetical protein
MMPDPMTGPDARAREITRLAWDCEHDDTVRGRVKRLIAEALREVQAERDAAEARERVLREALEWIRDAAERPRCVCGRPTGTAAIKAHAVAALAAPAPEPTPDVSTREADNPAASVDADHATGSSQVGAPGSLPPTPATERLIAAVKDMGNALAQADPATFSKLWPKVAAELNLLARPSAPETGNG